jgi:cyclopropane fatty-acyl-phospholipid synthase-like methyltransferase
MPPSPYDRLYAATEQLWPDTPGRMVVEAGHLLPPGRALDLGCGDGKNAVYLARRGWQVDAYDSSRLALTQFRARLARSNGLSGHVKWSHADVVQLSLPNGGYDLVVAYGLFHCLDESRFRRMCDRIKGALRVEGLLAIASFTPDLEIPANHGTGQLYPREAASVLEHFPNWSVLRHTEGRIVEEHVPAVAQHEHSVFWAVLSKPSQVTRMRG